MQGEVTTQDAASSLETRKDAFLINSKITDDEARQHLQALFDFHDKKIAVKNPTEQGRLMQNVAHYFLKNCRFLEDASDTDQNRLYQIDHHAMIGERVERHMERLCKIKTSHLIGESKNYRTAELDVDKVHKLVGITKLLGHQLSVFFSWTAMNGDELSAANGLVAAYAGSDNYHSVLLIFHKDDFEFLFKYPKLFGLLFYEKLRLFSTTRLSHNVVYSRILEEQAIYTPENPS
jgi:hypothetical protein